MANSSPEGIELGKGSKLLSMELSINKEKVLSIKQEKKYTEEDLKESWYNGMKSDNGFFGSFEEWFEQFKKK